MGKCVFNENWLQKDRYKHWLRRDSNNRKARCRLCSKSFDIGNMGESALVSHLKGIKHRQLEKRQTGSSVSNPTVKELLCSDTTNPGNKTKDSRPSTSTVNVSTHEKVQQPIVPNLDGAVSRDEVLKAEILWALKGIKSHFSYKSSEDSGKLFKEMFPDIAIAQKFACGERKNAYLCCFGIAPHFRKLLLDKVKSEAYHIILFDESLNKVTKTKQMDIHVRIWVDDKVLTRYYGSVFLGHATAHDMIDKFLDYIDLDLTKTLQISMDGPNVNWKFFDELQTEIFKQTDSKLDGNMHNWANPQF